MNFVIPNVGTVFTLEEDWDFATAANYYNSPLFDTYPPIGWKWDNYLDFFHASKNRADLKQKYDFCLPKGLSLKIKEIRIKQNSDRDYITLQVCGEPNLKFFLQIEYLNRVYINIDLTTWKH